MFCMLRYEWLVVMFCIFMFRIMEQRVVRIHVACVGIMVIWYVCVMCWTVDDYVLYVSYLGICCCVRSYVSHVGIPWGRYLCYVCWNTVNCVCLFRMLVQYVVEIYVSYVGILVVWYLRVVCLDTRCEYVGFSCWYDGN